ncbi:holin [Streptomyces yunnanensis]|uniref:Holin n=1 Tax=Streptomyces yunnanensis TaxID=156453 RepID=A0ABY8A9Z5_9ACTN|nr:holin [Streptomyces yunnanensis]WEB41524.1 holin [Streptomyces yunnanensis]
MPRRAMAICPTPGCPVPTPGGRCPSCRQDAEQRRGSARQRGYGREHETRFRRPVLARDPTCVLCGAKPSIHADHWPLSRRELLAQGRDPNDPSHGRGLCASCHAKHTAAAQPGGWNATNN